MTDVVFGDIEKTLVAWLIADQADLEADNVGTDRPHNLADRLPFVQVARVGGTDRDSLDRALVSLDVYAPDRGAARDGCEAVRTAFLTRLRGQVGDLVVTHVSTVAAPARRPYDNTSLRRYGATFRITFH